MNRLKRHIKRWNGWRKVNGNGRLHHILVLLGLVHSPTFGFYLLPEELPNMNNIFYGEEMFNREAYESAKGLCASVALTFNMKESEVIERFNSIGCTSFRLNNEELEELIKMKGENANEH